MLPENEYQDMLYLLRESVKLAKQDKPKQLMGLSDRIIHSASIYQDKYSLQLATAIYALAKIMLNDYVRRKFYKKYEAFIQKSIVLLTKARDLLSKRKIDEYYKVMSDLLKLIGDTDKRLGEYIEEVIRHAMIKKGSRIYAHGISMGRVAEILGISEWELMEKTGWMPEKEFIPTETLPPRERLKEAEELFG